MLEILQVAPKEVLHARNSLTGLTARILAYPPVPTTLSGVTPGAEFPDSDSAARTLGDLVRIRHTWKPVLLDHQCLASSYDCSLRPSATLCFNSNSAWSAEGQSGQHTYMPHMQ